MTETLDSALYAIRAVCQLHGVTIDVRGFDGRGNANLDARRGGRVIAMAFVRDGLWTWERALAILVERIETAASFEA